MENYDIVMLVVLIGTMLFGAFKGFAWQLASITSIGLSYFVAYRFREPLSQSIQADPPWNRFLAMLILYVGTSLVIWVAFRMVSRTIDRFKLKEFDRQVGAMFGLAKGALYCTLITLFAVTLLGESIRTQVIQSKSGRYIAQVLDRSESIIPAEIQEVVGPYLKRFDEQLRPDKSSETGSAGGLAPWINQVTQNVTQSNSWSEKLVVDPTSTSTAMNAWSSNPVTSVPKSTSQRQPISYSTPTFQQPSYPPSSSTPQPVQAAQRPWSSIYSSGGSR